MTDIPALRNRGRICVSIGLNDINEALAAAKEAEDVADVIEIRLDVLSSPEVKAFTQSLTTPLLFTYRPVWEGGFYEGKEADRLDRLVEAVREGAAYVDLELLAPVESFEKLSDALNHSTTKLIVSNHNFEITPTSAELVKTFEEMQKRGADIGKLITTANSHLDVLRVLQLLADAENADFPLIAFCMGQAGVISRLATLELGGYMTYCARNHQEATAPGQIPAETFREVLDTLGLTCRDQSDTDQQGETL